MGHRIKNQRLYLWVSLELKREVDEACKALGFTPSEFARQALMYYLTVIPKVKKENR